MDAAATLTVDTMVANGQWEEQLRGEGRASGHIVNP
jgi:hypothetical protein